MDIKRKINWINIGWLALTPLAMVALVPFQLWLEGFSWGWFLFFVVTCGITEMSITAGYHRLFAHRTYEARPWVEWLYLLGGAAAFQGSALVWATDHRQHHREVDTDGDPYNINRGFFYAHIGWLFYKDDTNTRFAPDLLAKKRLVFQDKYFVPLAILMGFFLPTAIGALFGSALAGFVWGGLVRVVFSQHFTFFINSLCHWYGRQPYCLTNSARDSLLMAVLAWGEGYHNYHHRFQSDYRNGIRWYHWDPTKWLIRGTALIGGAAKLKTVPETAILRARMQVTEARLVSHGVNSERLTALKSRVEDAQIRWRVLKEDYKVLRREVSAASQRKVINLKAELKLARLEFKYACAQWYAYTRTVRALPASA